MRILLDAHIALWAVTGSRRLSRKSRIVEILDIWPDAQPGALLAHG